MNLRFTFLLVVLTLTLTQCKKDNDLASDVVGVYTSNDGYWKITVNKVDDSTVWLYVEDIEYGDASLTFSETKMTSKTAFTLNKISKQDYEYDEETERDVLIVTEYTGTGTCTGKNIAINIHWKMFSEDYTSYEDDITITASK